MATLAALTRARPRIRGRSARRLPPSTRCSMELTPLTLVFSNREIVGILMRSAAFAVRRDDALGTLEPGKIADMVIVDGGPLADMRELFDIRVVISTGQVVVDHR